ncbi:hypothetical protein FISHEDRAFT_40992 [Fistulina hepatica ATCC 64428]|nr:hypothetical protein FISHEDRAFT_40992 [Fistulina hepatica ATCC 64428]
MSAFFYGSLMHPKILTKVINNDGLHLQICPACTPRPKDFTRHRVKDADYPGIIPYERSAKNFGTLLDHNEISVRGTLVTGLTPLDIKYLDEFEDDEYDRQEVEVHPLGAFITITEAITAIETEAKPSLLPSTPPPMPADLAPAVKADAYIFKQVEWLEAETWSYEDFVKNRAKHWYM